MSVTYIDFVLLAKTSVEPILKVIPHIHQLHSIYLIVVDSLAVVTDSSIIVVLF